MAASVLDRSVVAIDCTSRGVWKVLQYNCKTSQQNKNKRKEKSLLSFFFFKEAGIK
jgi:hypothetical protein